VWIFTDNQAAIMRIRTLKPGPGQEISIALTHISTELKALKCTLTIQWVPGHTDVAGNEKADQHAKLATTQRPPAFFRTSLSYLKRVAKAEMVSEWKNGGIPPRRKNRILWAIPPETGQNL